MVHLYASMDASKRLLVVEDNLALAGVIAFNLRQAGFEVVLRHNGVDAMARGPGTAFCINLAGPTDAGHER